MNFLRRTITVALSLVVTGISIAAAPTSRPAIGEADIADYCTVVLAPKLLDTLGANAQQREELQKLHTNLQMALDRSGDGHFGAREMTPGLVATRARGAMAVFGGKIRDVLTPEQERKLVDMLQDGTLGPITVDAAVAHSGPPAGPGSSTVTSVRLNYTHFGETGADAASPPTRLATAPVRNNPPAVATDTGQIVNPSPKFPQGLPSPNATADAGALLTTLNQFTLEGKNIGMRKVIWSPDGKIVGGVTGDAVQFWNVSAAQISKGPKTTLEFVNGRSAIPAAFSPDGNYFVTACFDTKLRVYSIQHANLKLLDTCEGHDAELFGVCFSHDGKTIVTTGGEMAVLFWDFKDGQATERNMIKIKGGFGAKYVTFSPDDSRVAVTSGTADVNTINIVDGKPQLMNTVQEPGANFELPMAASPITDQLLFASQKEARIWTEKKSTAWVAHDEFLSAVAWSPDGKYFATAGGDGRLIVWDNTGKTRYILQRPGGFTDVRFAPPTPDLPAGAFWVAALNSNGNMYLVELKDGPAPAAAVKN